MKILKEKYPLGTLKGQKSAGRYMEGYLYTNMEVIAKSIINDMTFLGFIFSSTLEVGTGKSVFATQMGEAWTEIMKKIHNIDVPFTTKNIVWRPKELMERAFQVPKYSFILLDEWEDNHYWSELGITLRQFFRKCRQLNLFIMCIIPNWFELPKGFAISRSAFAIDVKFEEGFKRGFYGFYSFNAKRSLYIKGKKDYNYFVARPTFNGKFVDGYGVPREEYLKAKREDLEKWEKADDPKEMKRNAKELELYESLKKKLTLTNKEWSELFSRSEKTIQNWNNTILLEKGSQLRKYGNYNSNTTSNVVLSPSEPEDNRLTE